MPHFFRFHMRRTRDRITHSIASSSSSSISSSNCSLSLSVRERSADMEEEMEAILLFCRLPTAGRAKTRLAAGSMRDDADVCAATAYEAMAAHALRQAACAAHVRRINGGGMDNNNATTTTTTTTTRRGNVMGCANAQQLQRPRRLIVLGSDADEQVAFREWVESTLVHGQAEIGVQAQDADLGVRMAAALSSALEKGAERAVLIGTDVPDISSDVIDNALLLLGNDRDVVLGPANDGGFYLIGAAKSLAMKTTITNGARTRAADAAATCSTPPGEYSREETTCESTSTETALLNLFDGVQWSTDGVLDAVLSNARKRASIPTTESETSSLASEVMNDATRCTHVHVDATSLPVLIDIDTVDDLRTWLDANASKECGANTSMTTKKESDRNLMRDALQRCLEAAHSGCSDEVHRCC